MDGQNDRLLSDASSGGLDDGQADYRKRLLSSASSDYRSAPRALSVGGGGGGTPLSTWHKPQGILDQCTVVAGSRITTALDPDPVLAAQLLQVETPLIELSSTRIRQRLAAGCSIRYMVPEKVEAYIAEKGLYRSL